MERDRGFVQGVDFTMGIPRPRRVDDFTLASNGKLIIKGESRRRSEPVPGTSNRRINSSGQRRR